MEDNSLAALEAQLKQLKVKTPKTKQTESEIKRIKSNINRVYSDAKATVLKAEETNFRYLIFLRSTNGFYKLTGHSALFYAFGIAPKLDIIVRLNPDGDYSSKSKTGIVSVKNLDSLAEMLKTLNIRRVKTKDQTGNIVAFQLPWTYSEAQLNNFENDNLLRIQKFNRIIMTEDTIPALFVQLSELNKAIFENVRGMGGPVEREALGYDMIKVAAKSERTYIAMSNGQINKYNGLTAIKTGLNFLKSQAKIIADLKIWSPRVCARIGDIMIKVQDILDQELRSAK